MLEAKESRRKNHCSSFSLTVVSWRNSWEAYIRGASEGYVYMCLITSKSRIAAIYKASIPRMELNGAKMSKRCRVAISNIEVIEVFYLSFGLPITSTQTLRYIGLYLLRGLLYCATGLNRRSKKDIRTSIFILFTHKIMV